MKHTLTELLARWDSDEGKPYKGSLIDMDAWRGREADDSALSCMCAQGQVLYSIGGWAADQIDETDQGTADCATAKLLNISRAHAVLLRNTNDSMDGAPSIVLTNPEKVLGSEWSKLLDFWWYLDQMTAKQCDAAWAAARDAARDAAWASNEIQGRKLMEERGQPLFFLPAFGFASVADIPARPANYGECAA